VDNTADASKPVSTAQAAADTAVQSFSIQRANHTGTQAASTISDFATEAAKYGPVVSVNGQTGAVVVSGGGSYTLPEASASVLGGIKVGSGLTIASGVLSTTGGGGSANIVERATAAAFPAGAANTIYIATDVGRVYRFDSSGVFVEIGAGGGPAAAPSLTAPTALTATAGNAQVSLAWTAPSGTITDYTVQYSSNSGSTWTTFSSRTASTTASQVVSGLTNGTAYVFRVAAVDSAAVVGAYTSASSSVTPAVDVFRAIPAMTSNTAPSGVVSGTGNRGGNTDDELWKAFDGLSSSDSVAYFTVADSSSPKRTLQYAFPVGQKSRISGYSISLDSPGDQSTVPRQFGFYGSDDLSTWTQIETRDAQTTGPNTWFGTSITAGEARTFTLPAAVNYRAYRWVFEETYTGQARTLSIREVSLVQ
jgi:hypothetical protein